MEQRIGNYAIFNGLAKEYLLKLSDKSCDEEYSAGEIIIKQGDKTFEDVYIIAQGEVDLYIKSKKVKTLVNGDIIGEYSVVTKSRHITIKSKTRTCLIKLNKKGFIEMLENTKIGDDIKQKIMSHIAESSSKYHIRFE